MQLAMFPSDGEINEIAGIALAQARNVMGFTGISLDGSSCLMVSPSHSVDIWLHETPEDHVDSDCDSDADGDSDSDCEGDLWQAEILDSWIEQLENSDKRESLRVEDRVQNLTSAAISASVEDNLTG